MTLLESVSHQRQGRSMVRRSSPGQVAGRSSVGCALAEAQTTNDRRRATSKRSRNSEVGEDATGAACRPAGPQGRGRACCPQLTNEKRRRVSGMNPFTQGCFSHAM